MVDHHRLHVRVGRHRRVGPTDDAKKEIAVVLWIVLGLGLILGHLLGVILR